MTTATDRALPRLLLGIGAEPLTSLDAHTNVYGPLPGLRSLAPMAVTGLAERSGLRGRGAASFPVGRELQTVASRGQQDCRRERQRGTVSLAGRKPR